MFAEGDHRKALQLFGEVLAAAPHAPAAAAARIAIAACHLRLGDHDLARAAYDRALRVDPANAAALAGRAAAELAAPDRESVALGVRLLGGAYAEDVAAAQVAAALATCHLLKGDLPAAEAFAVQAVRHHRRVPPAPRGCSAG